MGRTQKIMQRPASGSGFVLALFALAAISVQARIGLMTPFVDVVLDRLKIGQMYDVTQQGTQPFALTNRGQKAVTVIVYPSAEPAPLMKPGYEPIPDVSWIKVAPERFSLEPGETKSLKVILAIPKDPRLLGRHFQAALYSRTEKGGISVGLRSRLRFSVGAEKPAASAAEGKKPGENEVNVEFAPRSLSLQDIQSGRVVDLLKDRDAALKVANHGKFAVGVKLRSVYYGASSLPKGYVPTPNPDFLRIETGRVDIPAGGFQSVKLFAEIPEGNAHRGKRYAFLIRADVENQSGAEPVFARVFLRVKE